MVSSIVFAVAVLLKPQALILGPVFLVAFLIPLIVKKEKPLTVFLRTGICGATALLLIWLCSLLFKGEQGLFWIIEKYFVIMDGFPFASVNAANFYSMLGLNFADYTEKSWIFTAQTWGYIFIALATVVLVYFAFQSAKKKSVNIFLLGAFYSLAVFTFAQAMHERYSIIPLIFMIFAWAMIGDKRILKVATVQGVLTFANTLLAFFYMVKFEEMQVLAIGGSMKLISFSQVLLFCYFTYICIDIFTPIISNYRDKTKGKYMTAMTLPDEKPKKLQLTKKDLLFILVPTLVCAVFSFANLGDFNSPQTGVSIYENSNFEVSFKEGKTPSGVWCFTEIADGTVDFIKKGETEAFASMSAPYSSIFSWNVQNFEQDANEFVINGNNVKLNEMVFVDENDNLIKPTYFSPEIASLFDEQYLKPETITYKNGMYFDEVYHARTAYEQRNGLYIFENTHPPLGKVLIELGTYIFGMNPFGWRFAGVFLGVLLLPIMYLLAKSLFASSKIALFCQLLLMFDCLRYTQSRIATIDTPVVFFILLSYLFMVNFVKKDFIHDKIHTLVLPFFACGISFGLGCATKWTGIYSGAGLALILLLYLVKSYKEIDADEKKLYINRLAKIILCGIAFFVIIPIGIYILSYIPVYINSDTPFSLKLVWDNQIGMFDYHSKLTAT
ncbi:MAG: phospholipid carrier-dependent glycosyltransferase, partial [Oscillospiraceae bacterium]